MGTCPFHEDGEPSLVVTPSKNLWHCFGCQSGGDAIAWVMKLRGVSFRHAVELLHADPAFAADAQAAPVKRTSVRSLLKLPVAFDADEQALLNQVAKLLRRDPEAVARGAGLPGGTRAGSPGTGASLQAGLRQPHAGPAPAGKEP
ncbi:CHC2 zinc finger domain-containing protein [Massilia sp. H-1]|nr:CHC2 zinc finger domain-containing protein [Massilia sp. H-1]